MENLSYNYAETQHQINSGKITVINVIDSFLCIGMLWLGILSAIDVQINSNPLSYHPYTKWVINITDQIIEKLK